MKTELFAQSVLERVRFVYKLQLLGLLSYFLVLPFGNDTLMHLIIWAGAFLSLMTVAFGISLISITPQKVLSFFGVVFIILVQLLVHADRIDTNLIYSCFCFLSLFLMLEMSQNVVLDRSTWNFMCFSFIVAALLLSFYSFFPFAYFREDGTVCPYLTLNSGNANYAGMILLCVLLAIISIHVNYPKVIPFFFIEVFLFYLIVRTGSRSCIVAGSITATLAVFFRYKKIPNWLSVVMLLIPALWIPVYLLLYHLSSGTIAILGKNFFTGRQNIYGSYLNNIRTPFHFLFGNLIDVRLQNAHNAPLAVFCSVGIVGLLLFYSLIGSCLLKTKHSGDSTCRNLALFAIWGVLIGSSFEASLFLGGFPGVIFMYTFFILLAQSDKNSYIRRRSV